ncbi:hypothetical protein [Neptunomonas sp.]|uniref:hypothetical protein n=1 Tax=Neptunomonas sp. TaxID=1971898 RepID=UPI00356A58FE
MANLLPKLLQRSDYLAVENGIIILHPKNGDTITSSKWLKENFDQIATEILTLTRKQGYRFHRYSTGFYEAAKGSGGITLNFINQVTGTDSRISYNVDLRRARSTKAGKKGELLPKGRFIPPKGGSFVKLWRSSGLPIPKRISAFHDCMGKLKPIIFEGETTIKNGQLMLEKGTLKPMNISFDEILNSVLNESTASDKNPTRIRQEPDNYLTTT